jgi:uncharacterized protein YbjT (DUF2867 family)
MQNKPRILLTGATGYVGGRLLPCLLDAGYTVRCAVRRPESVTLAAHENLEVIQADLLDKTSMEVALQDMDVAYYLAHSLGSSENFEEKELQCAKNFADAAKETGLKRIIYLGGLGSGDDLSAHLRSRQRVGQILRDSGIPSIELRASIIIGSGSLSFEMVRALVDRLPAMIIPRWVKAKAQPIAIEDVIAYLLSSIHLSIDGSRLYEIGGPDTVSYMDIMLEYGQRRGLRPLMIPVPVLTPRLSSLWLGLITPLYARVGRKLVDSIQHDTLVEDEQALLDFPIKPRGLSEAIDRALKNEDREFAQTRWSDAFSSAGEPRSWGGVKLGARLIDSRSLSVNCSPGNAFSPIQSIGGTKGWYYANWAWWLRGALDLLVGGVGIRRGRSNPTKVAVGDTIDFWRVEEFKKNSLLRLRAEMKVPGRAWLQFEVDKKEGGSKIRQTAIFEPLGFFGLAYWYCLYPIHNLIFAGMLNAIADRAIKTQGG